MPDSTTSPRVRIRLALVGRIEVGEEGRVLVEVRLDRRDAVLEPARQPALAEFVLDPVQAALAHGQMIGTAPDGRNEPFGLTCRTPRPIACRRCADSS